MFTLYSHGEYILTVSSESGSATRYAAEEAERLLSRSLGVHALKRDDEAEAEADWSNKPILSVGKTPFSKQYDLYPFKAGEYVLDVSENQVVICGDGDEATAFGVFAFLEKYFGIKNYAPDETVVPKHERVEIPTSVTFEAPDFPARTLGSSLAFTEKKGLNLRLNENGKLWLMWAHTHFKLLPLFTYYPEHPDWYAESKQQLCLSSEGMTEQLIKNVCAHIEKEGMNERSTYFFMVGHEDADGFCQCEKCRKNYEKYGLSGTMMLFINKVAKAVNEYVSKNYVNKTVKIVTFGYGKTQEPPVKKTADGYELLAPELKAEKNVGVMLAPLGSNWAYSLTDEEHNAQTRKSLLGWNAVGAELFVWTYDGIFDDEFIFMDNYGHLAESYATFKKLNATYIFDECRSVGGIGFDCLSRYVRAKLLWNVEQDTETLIADFCKAYYRAGGEAVKAYIDLTRSRYEQIRKSYEAQGKPFKLLSYIRTQPMYRSEEWQSKNYLEECLSLFERAVAAAKSENDAEAVSRIEAEMLSPMYLYLELYAETLEASTLKAYVNDFKRIAAERHLLYYAEHGEDHNKKLYTKYVKWDALIRSEEKYGKELFDYRRS